MLSVAAEVVFQEKQSWAGSCRRREQRENERDRGEQIKSERIHEGAPCGWMVFLGKFAALAVSGAQLGTNTTWNREEACRSREGLLKECFTSNGKCLQLFAIV